MNGYEFVYIIDEKQYRVVVTPKKMTSIRYTYKDGVFKVSCPRFFVSQKQIINGLNKYARKLLNTDVRTFASGDDFIYLLGVKVKIQDSGEINFTNGDKITYKDRNDLEKKLKKWFLPIIENRHRYYESQMNVKKPYQVKLRKMTSRYGSNSSGTHSITYSMILLHYSVEIIDSVIVHELAHEYVRNHSQKFYNVVYKYCPNYTVLHRKLRKGEFK